jgi:hypothetical protein
MRVNELIDRISSSSLSVYLKRNPALLIDGWESAPSGLSEPERA